jgi:beta-glucosidase
MPRLLSVFLAGACLVSLSLPPPTRCVPPADFLSPQVDARIDALLARMSVEEKAGQLNQIATDSKGGPGQIVLSCDDLIEKGWVGAILGKGSAHDINLLQREAVEKSPQHIPILFGLDVIHGFRTTFPIPLGLSATWDPGLVEQTARFAAREASSEGVRWTFSPMVDIARDPRWGRTAEGAGEDPFLGSVMARAYVRGYQGAALDDPSSIIACAKHFVGYGAAEGGREYNTTEISERTLRDVYLPPFHAAVEEGTRTLMSAFNSLDGVPASANAFTLSQVLRGEWGFQGFVDSDWTAIRELMLHGIADDEESAARKGFLAGVDMDMQSGLFLRELPGLVCSGQVPMKRLDDSVRRILRTKAQLGLFDRPYVPEPGGLAPSTAPEGRQLALRAAEESFVLLENRAVGGAPLLPISAAPGMRIALIGPLADSAEDMLGCWSCAGRPAEMVTLRSALAERAAQVGFQVSFAKGTEVAGGSDSGFAEAVGDARKSDLVVMALGESRSSSGEAASRSSLDLPGNQEQLLEAVVAAGKPVVLIVFSGRPLAITWASEHVPAILMAWSPGMEAGSALVRTIFGDSEPEGRLTVSIPRSLGQVPIYYDHLNTGRPRVDSIGLGEGKSDTFYVTGYIDEKDVPLYPFGHGLTYSSFSYSPVSVDAGVVSAAAVERGDARVTVGADIRNVGSREGAETAQLYIRLRGTSVARPVRELKGFERVTLAPGETKHVEFKLGREELAFWGIDMKRAVEPCSLYIWVAPDSAQGRPAKVVLTE